MDINSMQYLIEIVDAGFNLTAAASKLYLSQSALSQFIKTFQTDHDVSLFKRKNGRIVGFTSAGRKIYQAALEVNHKYEEFISVIEKESLRQKGTFRLGAHPTILRLFFRKFIPQFMLEYPEAFIETVEAGSLVLSEMMEDEVLHAAILSQPTHLDPDKYEQHLLGRTEVAAFMNPDHPLANKHILSWKDIDGYFYTTYNSTDGLVSEIQEKLRAHDSHAKLLISSDSWDYLIEAAEVNELIAILPTASFDMFRQNIQQVGVVEKRFSDPIAYIPTLVRQKKSKYSKLESFIFASILENFYDDKHNLRYDFLKK